MLAVNQGAQLTSHVRSRAPLRLGLAGGGTDLSPYSDLYGGAVLNVTIDRFAYASLRLGRGNKVVMHADDLDVTETEDPDILSTTGPLTLHRGVYNRIVREFNGGLPFPAEISTMIDAPPGSGLGSSSALVVALVDVFREALSLPLGRYDVAHVAFEVERLELKLQGGKQDHYAAAFGGVNFIEFLPSDRVIVNPLRVTEATMRELQSSIIICFTGQSRASEQIIRDQIASVVDVNPIAIESMHRLKADALDMKQALLRGHLGEVASILDRSWQSKKQTASSVSNALIEALWRTAHESGALAGKVSGAGGGGFMFFLVDPDQRARVARALSSVGGNPDSVYLTNEGVESWTIAQNNVSSQISRSLVI